MEALFAEADTIVVVAEEVARAPRRRGGHAADDVRFALTPREHEVLRLLAQGKTDREIADALVVSRRTVNAHVANILSQLGVHARDEAVALARELALLPKAANASRYT
jgi:DNA-binding NarL/FixJ family response regulator